MRVPKGFTVVEVLVVIGIIGVLVAILVPAVQAARESARRVQCLNNLRQMGLAFHTYHSAHEKFPKGGAGEVSLTDPVIRAKWRLSWGAAILPHLGRSDLYDLIDQSQPYTHDNNHEVGKAIVNQYVCPTNSRKHPHKLVTISPGKRASFAKTDYGGNYGERGLRCFPLSNCQNKYPNDSSGGGRGTVLLGADRDVSLTDVKDGASQTILLGEAPEGLHSIWIGHKNTFDQSAPINAHINSASPWPSCQPVFKSPEGEFCDYGQEFHSYHRGGATFVYVDSSTHFLNDSIDNKALAAILSRDGREVLPNSE